MWGTLLNRFSGSVLNLHGYDFLTGGSAENKHWLSLQTHTWTKMSCRTAKPQCHMVCSESWLTCSLFGVDLAPVVSLYGFSYYFQRLKLGISKGCLLQ